METKPKNLMEYALLEVPVPGTTWVVPFAIGGLIVGSILWVIAYNIQRQKGLI